MLIPSKLLLYQSLISIIHSFQKAGVFDELKKHVDGISSDDLAESLVLNSRTLLPLCDFLAINVPELLYKKNGKYTLGPQFLEKGFQNSLFFSLAYESVFENLFELLQGKKEYEKDFIRNGEYLSISSAIYNDVAWNTIIDALKSSSVETLIDIGCGAGDFLSRVKETFDNIECFGVEIDKTAISAFNAKGLIKDSKVSVIEGDGAQPEKWKDVLLPNLNLNKTVITGVTLWHEFLYFGDHYLVDLFKRYRKWFPGCKFIFVEYNTFSFDEFNGLPFSLKESASAYQLVHPLTLQGVPPKKEAWRSILEKAGIILTEEISVAPNSTIYVCVL